MKLRSGIGLALLTWVTAAATLMAGWRAPGPACACPTVTPASGASCCCSKPKDPAPRSCCHQTVPKSCCEPIPAGADGCHCAPAAPDPVAPPVFPRPATEVDEFGPFAAAVQTLGAARPPAGHPAFASRAHPAPAPPIDLTISLSRLTC